MVFILDTYSFPWQLATQQKEFLVDGAQDGVNRFQKLMGSKMLELNVSKSIYMVVGRKKNVSRIRKEIESKPILYNGTTLKEKETEKWLGDVLNVKGNKASTLSSINERTHRIYNIMNETVAIIEDSRVNRIGSMKSAKKIWEMAVVRSLLNNSGFN